MSENENLILNDLKQAIKPIITETVPAAFHFFIPPIDKVIYAHREVILQWLRRNKQKIAQL